MKMARRTSFTFSPQAVAQLGAIRSRTHLDDNSAVIRSALNAYDELVRLAAEGNQMFVRDTQGDKWPYSPYIKLSYPGLRREEINAEAADAAKGFKSETYFFSGEVIKKIESLRKRSHLGTNIEAIRVALSAFKELVLVLEAGDTFFVRDRDGVETPYNPFQPFGAVSRSAEDITGENDAALAAKRRDDDDGAYADSETLEDA